MPDLPSHYLPREADLAGLKQKLLAEDALLGITGKSSARRRPGYAVLTAALAQDSEVRQTFSEDIYWLTAGQKPNLLDLQNRLLRQLTGSKETLITEQKVKGALREAIEGRTPEQQRKPLGEKKPPHHQTVRILGGASSREPVVADFPVPVGRLLAEGHAA